MATSAVHVPHRDAVTAKHEYVEIDRGSDDDVDLAKELEASKKVKLN